MSKIKVVSIEKDSPDLATLSNNDLYDVFMKIIQEDKTETYRIMMDMYMNMKSDMAPLINNADDFIMYYLFKTYDDITPVCKFNKSHTIPPWNIVVPKVNDNDTIRVKVSAPKKVIDINTYDNYTVPSGSYIDVYRIRYGKTEWSIKSIKNLYRRILYRKYYRNTDTYHYIHEQNINLSSLVTYDSILPKFSRGENVDKIKHFLTEKNIPLRMWNFGKLYIYDVWNDYMTYMLHNTVKKPIVSKNNQELIYANSIKRYLILNIIKTKIHHALPGNMGTLSAIMEKLSKTEQNMVTELYEDKVKYIKSVQNNKCPHIRLLFDISTNPRMLKRLEKYMKNPHTKTEFITCNNCSMNIMCPHNYSIETKTLTDISIYITNGGVCKICDEFIQRTNIEDVIVDSYDTLYSKVITYMYSACYNIYNLLKFTPYISALEFTSIVVSNISSSFIHCPIKEIAIELDKFIKIDEVSYVLKLYVYIYLYGYIVSIIRYQMLHNTDNILKIDLVEGTKKSYVEDIVKRFNNQHRNVYMGLDRINVLESIAAVYKYMTTIPIHMYIRVPHNKKELLIYEIKTYTVYKYADYIRNLIGIVNKNDESNISEIFGININDIEKNMTSNAPHFFDKMYIPALDNLNEFKKDAALNYIKFIEHLKTGKDLEYKPTVNYKNIATSVVSFRKYKYIDISSHISDKYLPLIYDENGNEHIWNIMIYDNDTVKTHTNKILDCKCGTCGKRRLSVVDSSDLQKIISQRKTIVDTEKVVKYFDFLCPMSDSMYHKYDDKNICTLCGKGALSSDKFYDKYKDKVQIHTLQYQSKIISDDVKNVSNFVYDPSHIVQLSAITGVNMKLIEAIGSFSNIEFDKILISDRVDFPDTRKHVQIDKLYGYFLYTIQIYNRIRFKSHIPHSTELGPIDIVVPDEALYEKNVASVNAILNDVTKTGKIICQCILQNICEFLITISNIKPDGIKLSKIILDSIITLESYSCVPGVHDKTLFNVKKRYDVIFNIEMDDTADDEEKLYDDDGDIPSYNYSIDNS